MHRGQGNRSTERTRKFRAVDTYSNSSQKQNLLYISSGGIMFETIRAIRQPILRVGVCIYIYRSIMFTRGTQIGRRLFNKNFRETF